METSPGRLAPLAFAVYIAGVLILAAVLAPIFFAGGKLFLATAASHGWRDSPSIGWIVRAAEKTEFPGYFDRAALVVALCGLWPLFKTLRMTRKEVLGHESFGRGAGRVVLGFAMAVAVIAVLGAGFAAFGVCKLRPANVWNIIPPITSGLTVACLEEFLFRGAMLGVLCRSLRPLQAMLVTTFVFAFLHFLKQPGDGAIPDEAVRWSSGFWVITQLLNGFARWQNILAEFLLLFAVGWVLARARVASGGLGLCIGLHAGWVAAMKYFSQIAAPTTALRRGEFFPFITENHCKAIVGSYVGLAPVIAILLSGWLALAWTRRGARENPVAKANT